MATIPISWSRPTRARRRFSDTANAIALTRGFWLGDAFASGGSVGYDHKKMGITARGAWEAVKRHFRELDRDIQREPFTAVGVGDMSGDVFGNGMLLSRADAADRGLRPSRHLHRSRPRSRRRAMPSARGSSRCRARAGRTTTRRSCRAAAASISRAEKSVPLSPEARTALGLGTGDLTPDDVMRAILKSPTSTSCSSAASAPTSAPRARPRRRRATRPTTRCASPAPM